MTKTKYNARVLIPDINSLSDKERHQLALWLRRLGSHLEKQPKLYSKNFRATRYT